MKNLIIVPYLVSSSTKVIDEWLTKFKRPPYLFKRGITKWQMIGQSGKKKVADDWSTQNNSATDD